jgi:DNA-binding NtrC family response regulator
MRNTLLLLDDELVIVKLLRSVLNRYNLIEATTAEQALELLINNGRQLDLLAAGLTLPTRSGIEIALVFRLEFPDLPVILTSGYPVCSWSDHDSACLKRLGSNSVAILQKPFLPQLLINTICDLMGSAARNVEACETGNASVV